MIKSPFQLFQVERKIGFGNTPVLVKPMLGKRPKTFDPIDVIPTFRHTFFF
jgi:hypothetical protein